MQAEKCEAILVFGVLPNQRNTRKIQCEKPVLSELPLALESCHCVHGFLRRHRRHRRADLRCRFFLLARIDHNRRLCCCSLDGHYCICCCPFVDDRNRRPFFGIGLVGSHYHRLRCVFFCQTRLCPPWSNSNCFLIYYFLL